MACISSAFFIFPAVMPRFFAFFLISAIVIDFFNAFATGILFSFHKSVVSACAKRLSTNSRHRERIWPGPYIGRFNAPHYARYSSPKIGARKAETRPA
jgi:hypothetical protein